MKKKALSLLLALTVCLTMLPSGVFAADGQPEQTPQTGQNVLQSEEPADEPQDGNDSTEPDKQISLHSDTAGEHKHPVCGASCNDGEDHTDEIWEAISSEAELKSINAAGNYYLTNDIMLSSTWMPADGVNVNLCLNGYSIIANGNFYTIQIGAYSGEDEGLNFTLTDCKGTGEITHEKENSRAGVRMLYTKNGSTFNMYSGIIKGNGVGVYISMHCIFNMYGGEISGNGGNVKNDNEQFGGVNVTFGSFNMYGGSITGNINNNNDNNLEGYGGGVYVRGDQDKGTFSMYGGSITGNSAEKDGGGVYLYGQGYTQSAILNMYGGEISGNSASRDGGGVCANDKGDITVSGDVKIIGNVKKGTLDADSGQYSEDTANNVYLLYGQTINIGKDGLKNSSSIGVTTQYSAGGYNRTKIVTGASENDDADYAKIFEPDVKDKYYEITKDEKGNLHLGEHQHKWTYALSAAKDNTITATCRNCLKENGADYSGGSVTIIAPADVKYDGKRKSATLDKISGGWQGGQVNITYSKEME